MSLCDGDGMARVFFGENAIHIPLHRCVQDAGPGVVSVVGVSGLKADQHPLRFGSEMTHQLVTCDLILRPHRVIESNAFRGTGLAYLVTDAMSDIDEWIRTGRVLIDRFSRAAPR
jgi:hypothetical protein